MSESRSTSQSSQWLPKSLVAYEWPFWAAGTLPSFRLATKAERFLLRSLAGLTVAHLLSRHSAETPFDVHIYDQALTPLLSTSKRGAS